MRKVVDQPETTREELVSDLKTEHHVRLLP